MFVLFLHMGYRQFTLSKVLTANGCSCYSATSIRTFQNVAIATEFFAKIENRILARKVLREAMLLFYGRVVFFVSLVAAALTGIVLGA